MNPPRRISGPLAALGSAAIVVGLLAQPTPIGAASPQEMTLSAWGVAPAVPHHDTILPSCWSSDGVGCA